MPTNLHGSREPRYVDTRAYRNNVSISAVPNGFRAGKMLYPYAGNEFVSSLNGVSTPGISQIVVPLVSGQVPVLMGIRAALNSTADEGQITLTTGSARFLFNAGYLGQLSMIFTPIGFVSSNVEHGLNFLQPAGVAVAVRIIAWGYYALIP